MTDPQKTMSAALADSHGPGIAVQAYSTLVLQAPDMHFDAIEDHPDVVASLDKAGRDAAAAAVTALRNINTHLGVARGHANTWKSTLLPLMFGTNSDIEGYGREYVAVTTDLIKRIDALGPNPTDSDYQQLVVLIQRELGALQTAIVPRVANAKQVATALADFASQLADDTGKFTADGTAVNTVIVGDKGLVASLNDELSALNSAISKDIAMIGGGAAAIVTGIGIAVLGGVLVATGVGAPIGIAVIAAGVVVAGGGVALTVIGGIDLKKKRDQLMADQQELSVLDACVTYFNNASDVVSKLANSAKQAADGADQLHSLWTAQQTALAEVLQNVTDAKSLADVLSVCEPFLRAARDEWSEAQTAADRIAQALEGLRDNVSTALYSAAA